MAQIEQKFVCHTQVSRAVVYAEVRPVSCSYFVQFLSHLDQCCLCCVQHGAQDHVLLTFYCRGPIVYGVRVRVGYYPLVYSGKNVLSSLGHRHSFCSLISVFLMSTSALWLSFYVGEYNSHYYFCCFGFLRLGWPMVAPISLELSGTKGVCHHSQFLTAVSVLADYSIG